MITSVSPGQGGVGASVRIYGSSFGAQQNGSTVTISGVAVQPNNWSNWEIDLTVPQIAASGPVEVTVAGVHSNPMPFQFILASRSSTQTVYISPDEVSLSVGDLRQLKLVDSQGNEITDATWSVDNTSVADITYPPNTPTDTPTSPSLEGLGPGETTITAVSSLGSAQALARVFPSGPLPAGTTAWSVYPDTFNNWFSSVLQGQPKNPGDPDLFITESLSSGGSSIRALDQSGQQLWRKYFDQPPQTSIATPDGGLLTQIGTSMTKFSGTGDQLWTVPNTGGFGPGAVGYDGTIYASGPVGGGSGFGVFDGDSGSLRYTVSLPTSLLTVTPGEHNTNPSCSNSPVQYPSPGQSTALVVATNGKAYYGTQVINATYVSDGVCDFSTIASGYYQQMTNTYIVELSPQGGAATITVYQDSYSGNVWSFEPPVLFEPQDCGAIQYQYFCNERIPETLLNSPAPDGAGGVLAGLTYRPQDATQPDQQNLVRVVDGGVAYTIPVPGLAGFGGATAAGIAVTDDNGVVLNPVQALNVIKIDPTTGSILWSTPQATNGDNIYLQDATDDGGLLLQDVLYNPDGTATTTLLQLDPNGTQTASTSVARDLSLATAIHLSSGDLLTQDQNTSALQDMPLPTAFSGPGLTFPIIGVGNNSKTKAAKPVTVKEFQGSSPKHCTGYDDKYNALMTPQSPNSNTLQITAKTKGHDVTLIPSPNINAVTFSPSKVIPGDGQPHQVTVSGQSNLGTFQITAFSDDGTPLGAPFQVDIKPLKTINTVTIFSIVAPGLIPPHVPTPSTLQTELDRIFPRQANITFSGVVDGGSYNFSYDKYPFDGALYYDVGSKGSGCFPFPLPTPCRTSKSELGPLLDSFYVPSGQHNQGDASDFQAMYFNNLAKANLNGYSVAGNPTLPAIVKTDYGTSYAVANFRENTTSHEIGHILGVGASFTINGQSVLSMQHDNRGFDFLMNKDSYYSSASCRLSRDDWNLMNFTPGTKILGDDNKAH